MLPFLRLSRCRRHEGALDAFRFTMKDAVTGGRIYGDLPFRKEPGQLLPLTLLAFSPMIHYAPNDIISKSRQHSSAHAFIMPLPNVMLLSPTAGFSTLRYFHLYLPISDDFGRLPRARITIIFSCRRRENFALATPPLAPRRFGDVDKRKRNIFFLIFAPRFTKFYRAKMRKSPNKSISFTGLCRQSRRALGSTIFLHSLIMPDISHFYRAPMCYSLI